MRLLTKSLLLSTIAMLPLSCFAFATYQSSVDPGFVQTEITGAGPYSTGYQGNHKQGWYGHTLTDITVHSAFIYGEYWARTSNDIPFAVEPHGYLKVADSDVQFSSKGLPTWKLSISNYTAKHTKIDSINLTCTSSYDWEGYVSISCS